MSFKPGDEIFVLPNRILAPEGLGIVIGGNDYTITYKSSNSPTEENYPWAVWPEHILLVNDLTDLEKALHGIE